MEGSCGKEAGLPGLGGGVINFEDVEVGVGIAEAEGIEPRAEKDVLGHAVGDGGGEDVFGEARAGDDEGTEGVGVGAVGAGGGSLKLFSVDGAEDRYCEGIGEDEGISVDELMGGSPEGNAKSGAGWGGGCNPGDGSRPRVRSLAVLRKSSKLGCEPYRL